MNANNDLHVNEIVEIIKKLHAVLVVIDNLGTISGGADENSAEMIKVLSNLRIISERTNTVLNVIHHPRKSEANKGRPGDSLRGHSSIEAALDLALRVTREPKSDLINLVATKSRGAEVAPFSALFTYQHDASGELAAARFYASSSEQHPTISTISTIYQAILSALDGKSLNKTTLTEQVYNSLDKKVGMNRIGLNIDQMVSDEYLIKN